MSSRDSGDNLFAGGGDMGALMRSIDWSRTPLGPVASWSQALRTTVGLLLRNRFPLLLWWGPRFVQLYNDAYRAIPGAKHPRSMGQPAAECWEEIWHVIGPMIEAPFRGEPATWSDDLFLMINRKGFVEETHFKVAYSPVPDESVASGIGGVLATVAEITEEVYARRQLATLRDLARQAVDVKSSEAACAAAARSIEENARDIPSALFYLVDEKAASAYLVHATGAGEPAALGVPGRFVLGDPSPLWPVMQVVRDRRMALAPAGRVLPSGAWRQAPTEVAVLPLASPEQLRPYGVLVAALSPHREVSLAYRSFLELVADQVSSAIRNALAYQHQIERAEKLAELDRAKTTFFSNVSHEFRTPLTLMLGPIEDMRAERGDDAEARERTELLHRNALRLLKLVNTLLDFSRIEAGRIQAVYAPTDLSALTADLASSFRSAIERGGVSLVVACDPLPEPIFVDSDMWEKIVLNLVSNAFKFTFEGAIRVTLRAEEDAALLEVADTGTGIAEHELPRLFERFHRIEGARSRSHEGSGIGLALVSELVRLHGGRIGVASALGEGTTFSIRIPRGCAHLPVERIRAGRTLTSTATGSDAYVQEALRWSAPPDSVGPVSMPIALAQRRPSSRKRIVVADDNADMREYLGRLLRERWDVTTVENGKQALEHIRAAAPDLVVSDVMMPELDGFGLLRAIRDGDGALKSIPVILLSARAGEEATAEGLKAGADDYIVKPFTARELIVRVAARLTSADARDEERRRLLALLGQVPAVINFLRGPDFVFEFVHPRAVQTLGGRDLLGRPLREAVPELRDQPPCERLRLVYETGRPWADQEALIRLTVGGEPVETYWDSVFLPVRGPAGQVEGVMTFGVDVTEKVRARQELERLNRTKDEFLATMSHELRTPLNAMLGWTTILKGKLGDGNLVRRGLEVIERNARAQERLVSDLLDVSRIISGKLELHVRRTDLAAVLSAALDVVRPAAQAKGVSLVTAIAPELGCADVDPDRIQQVVWNLLINAVRFTRRGGRIMLSALHSEGSIAVRVEDSGAGIAPEHLPFIFDRFRQADSSTTRSHGGLGLGLAIVRHLVEAHGGTVQAHSDGPGTGATFTVSLPRRILNNAAPAGAGSGARLPDAEHRAGVPTLLGARVLAVDDDADALELLRWLLEPTGARLTLVRSADEALEAAGPFDAVISDLGMPGTDGFELIRRIRSLETGADVPAIALTAYARPEDAERAVRAGYQLHIPKPVHAAELLAGLERLVLERRAAEA